MMQLSPSSYFIRGFMFTFCKNILLVVSYLCSVKSFIHEKFSSTERLHASSEVIFHLSCWAAESSV